MTDKGNLLKFSMTFAVLLASGCSVGEESVLFMTKTSVGVDVDATPLTLDIGFARREGTISPVFEDGRVLPQMAGYTSQLGIVNQAVGQSFATGTAAVIMSRYLTSNLKPNLGSVIPDAELTASGSIATKGAERKRYFFATDTSLGFRVNFGMESGGLPDGLSLGYKRKEAAFAPLIPGVKDATTGSVALPSLLATSGLGTDVNNPHSSELVQNQFFATGRAASNLAALPGIRQAVALRIMPDAKTALDQTAFKEGLKISEVRNDKADKVIAAVSGDGKAVDKSKLVDLFEKAKIPAEDGKRVELEGYTETRHLKIKLKIYHQTLDKLVAAIGPGA